MDDRSRVRGSRTTSQPLAPMELPTPMEVLGSLPAPWEAFAECVARRVVELAAEGLPAPSQVDANTLAPLLGMSAPWVRAHAVQLGGVRMGDGPRPRWRFDPERARVAFARLSGERSPTSDPSVLSGSARRRRGPGSGSNVDLLPIRGRSGGPRAA